MRNDGLRIIKATTTFSSVGSGYDSTHSYINGYELDFSRKTAVLMRQSRKGGDQLNPESRLRQEGLVRIAVDIRSDHDPLMVIPCDEGSGVSGQKKIYERPKLLELWRAIHDGSVGSVIVAREDRLFRDRFLTQVTQFTEECAKHGVLVIIAGRRCYDFRISDDFNAFIRKMQEAYGYIDTHVRYMQQMLQQKLARGEWVGGGLVAPYALDRVAIAAAREQRKVLKEFGSSEEDELLITKAYRPVIIEGAFEAAISRDLFEPSYEAITGFTLDGKSSNMMPNRSRFARTRSQRVNALPTQLFRSPDTRITFRADYDSPGVTYYAAHLTQARQNGEGASYLESNKLWSLPATLFDQAIVARLTDVAEHDKELANRVEKYYKALTESKESEKATILNDINKLQALIAHYDRLIHNPARPLTTAQEARTLEAQAQTEADLEKAQAALLRYERSQPSEFIPAFYRILGAAPGEFWNMDMDRQRHMLSLLIDEIQVTNIAPHMYKLLMKWKDPVAQHWDSALIFKRQAVRTKLAGVSEWNDEEDKLLRQLWPAADKLDLHKAFPAKTGNAIKARATGFGLKRNQRMPEKISPIQYSLCYEDWIQSCPFPRKLIEYDEEICFQKQGRNVISGERVKRNRIWQRRRIQRIGCVQAKAKSVS